MLPIQRKEGLKLISSLQLGAFFGAIFAFFCGDKLGRKKTIWVAVAANVAGALLQITSWHLPQMIVGRVINGFGMGEKMGFIVHATAKIIANLGGAQVSPHQHVPYTKQSALSLESVGSLLLFSRSAIPPPSASLTG